MMSKYLRLFVVVMTFVGIMAVGSTALATNDLATTFTYQGFLSNNGTAYDGPCDFEFRLYDAPSAGTQLGTLQTESAVSVNGGVFTVALNGSGQFGATAFDGNDRYLDIKVRCPAGTGVFTQLLPRTAITSAPSALYSANAANAMNAINAANATTAATAAVANGLNGLIVQQNATSPNLIGGFSSNNVLAGTVGATIGGGGVAAHVNSITDNYATVGGGYENRAGDGDADPTNNRFSTIAGGAVNTAGGAVSFIGGGEENVANGPHSVVAGGFQNSANNFFAAVGGGGNNTAGGQYSTIPGGRENSTSADYSFAAGRRAQANAAGSFVWADSTGTTLTNTTADTFVVRAAGGFWFGDTGSTPTFTPGALISTSTGGFLSAAGDWQNPSDEALKENFSTVDTQDILQKVATLPITSWNYKVQDDSVRHIGPMAQDFYADFGTGLDDKHISNIDSAGIALAAIQGLYQVVQDKDAQIATLQTENAELKTRLDALDERLSALEALAAPSQAGLSLPVMLAGMLLVGGLGFAGRRMLRKDASL